MLYGIITIADCRSLPVALQVFHLHSCEEEKFLLTFCPFTPQVEEVESDKSDLTLTLSSVTLRQILAGTKTVQEVREDSSIEIDRRESDLFKFFSCFELGDETLKK